MSRFHRRFGACGKEIGRGVLNRRAFLVYCLPIEEAMKCATPVC